MEISQVKQRDNPAFGATTRRQWSQWVATPVHRSKENTCTNAPSDGKVERKNLKKLRLTQQIGLKQQIENVERTKRPKRLQKKKFSHKKRTVGSRRNKTRVPAATMDALDFFHKQTLITTSQEGYNSTESFNDKRMTQSLHNYCFQSPGVSLSKDVVMKQELEDVTSVTNERDVHAAVDTYFEDQKKQFLQFIEHMRTPNFREKLVKDFTAHREQNQDLKSRLSHLEKQISNLQKESISHLRARLAELGIVANTPAEFLSKAKEIVLKHKELQAQATNMQAHVAHLDEDQHKLLQFHCSVHAASGKLNGTKHPDLGQVPQEFFLREMAASIAHHMKLHDKAIKLEGEVTNLEGPGSQKSSPISRSGATDKSPRSSSSFSSPSSMSKGSNKNSPKAASPRRRSDPHKVKGRADKNPPENLETFDAHLKSIITNALMCEGNMDSSSKSCGTSSRKGQSPGRKDKSPAALSSVKRDLANFKPSSVQESAILMALQRRHSPEKTTVQKKAVIDCDPNSARVKTCGGMPSIKVTIPLKEPGKRPPSLPVSIPLASVRENLGLLNKDSHMCGRKDNNTKDPMARSGSPYLGDAYSPISRPSSSSSTISAESVKYLEHGACVQHTSPKAPTTTQATDIVTSAPAATSAKETSVVPTGSKAVPPFNTGHMPDQMGSVCMPPPFPAYGLPPNAAGVVFPFPVPDKEVYMKMLQNGPRFPYGMAPADLAAQAAFLGLTPPVNGLPRGPANTSEDKPPLSKKSRRKRPYSKCVTGGSSGGGNVKKTNVVTRPNSHAAAGGEQLLEFHHAGGKCVDSMGQHNLAVMGKSKGQGLARQVVHPMGSQQGAQPSDIDCMVSNASQPLAITAISDVESTKSSPLEPSPTKAFVPGTLMSDRPGSAADGERQKDSPTTHHWQTQIENSFNTLIDFASSELDRTREMRRRSSEQERPGQSTGEASKNPKDGRHLPGDHREAGYARSDSRSDSRDSGLGKDSEMESMERSHGASNVTPLSTLPADQLKHAAHSDRLSSRIPRQTLTPTSPGTSRNPGVSSAEKLSRSALEMSPSRQRSRSRSPIKDSLEKPNDKYCNYDKHFKKKFLKKSWKSPPSSPSEGIYGKFRPKGKDWEKNQKADCGSSEHRSGGSKDSGSSDQADATSESSSKDRQQVACNPDTADIQGTSKTLASGDKKHSSAYASQQLLQSSTSNGASEVSRPQSASPFTVPSTPNSFTPVGSTSQGRRSTGTPGSSHSGSVSGTYSGQSHSAPSDHSSVPSSGPVRPPADLPHCSFAELAAQQASLGPFTGAHQALTEAMSRGHPPPPHLLSAGLLPHRLDLPPFDFESSRMAMLAELAGQRGPGFSVSFGGPPTFRPPFGAEFGPRQASIGDFPMTRPGFAEVSSGQRGFSSEGQIFPPMSRGGKDKSWQNLGSSNSSTASSKP